MPVGRTRALPLSMCLGILFLGSIARAEGTVSFALERRSGPIIAFVMDHS